MRNLEELQETVKNNIVLSEEKGIYYADVIEENGDEFRLTQSTDLDELHDQLKGFGHIN